MRAVDRSTLVFPAGMPAALTWARRALLSGTQLGGAPSVPLLHIDGNHAVRAVRNDIALWRRWVQPGGWLVLDDYCWSFGDGPKIAADEFCQEFAGSLANGFVMHGGLFLRVVKPIGEASARN